jgi:2-methylcitrate dehydratase PrpD
VLASALTDAGFRGAAEPIEGTFGFLHGYTDDSNPEALAAISPGAAVRETALKPYPCCRYMHAAIDAILDMRANLALDAVKSITLDLPGPGVRLTGEPIEQKRQPTNFVDCQFSAPFAAALALSAGEADLGTFLDAQDELDDPALRALMDRVTVVSTERTNEPFPTQWTAHAVVETSDRHERFVEHPRGEPENPLSWTAVEAKFHDLIRSTDLEGTANAVVDAVGGLGARSTTGDLFNAIERP